MAYPVFSVAAIILGAHTGPSATAILDQCQRAYDSVRTLEVDVQGKGAAGKGTAHISFMRPNKLRVSGTSFFNTTYDLLVNGHVVSLKNGGGWQPMNTVEMAVASVTGVSSNAATNVPALLFHTKWGALVGMDTSHLKVSKALYQQIPCYRVDVPGQMPRSIWIDQKTYFLVRVTTTVFHVTMDVTFSKPRVNLAIPSSRFAK